MKTQSDLIGSHPTESSIFAEWFNCEDIEVKPTKKHRALTSKIEEDNCELMNYLGELLVKHHYNLREIEIIKKVFDELGYPNFAATRSKLPTLDTTKKGNFTEILLLEYIQACLGKPLTFVYRLIYNPNVNQAMKGDDVLLIDIINEETKKKIKVYFGEAKFRSIPNKTVVKDILDSLSKSKSPVSLPFMINLLALSSDNEEVVAILDTIVLDEIKGQGSLIYTGLLFGNSSTSTTVERHLNSDNPEMVFISINTNEPDLIVNSAFESAINHIESL